jgi:hypothetical protein
MLGPELVNLAARIPPVFLEGAPSVRLDSATAAALGLSNHQIIRGLVSTNASQLFLNADGFNNTIALPEFFRRFAGKRLIFRSAQGSHGNVTMRAVSLADMPQNVESSSAGARKISSANLLRAIFNAGLSMELPKEAKAALLSFDYRLSLDQSVRNQTELVRQLFLRSGYFSSRDNAGASISWPKLILRLANFENRQVKQIARALLSELLIGAERTSKALSNDLVVMDTCFWLNRTPVQLSLFRGQRGGSEDSHFKWTLNMHLRFSTDSQIWLKVEHSQAKMDLAVTSWILDSELYTKARESAEAFSNEVSAFGLNLVSFSIVNAPRDDTSKITTGQDRWSSAKSMVDETA